MQFSSLGSLDEKWLSEFSFSMSSGVMHGKSPLGIGKPLIIWPTVEDVRCSLEVYQPLDCEFVSDFHQDITGLYLMVVFACSFLFNSFYYYKFVAVNNLAFN